MSEYEVNQAWRFKLETYKRTAQQWAEMPGENRPIVEKAWMQGLGMLLGEAEVILDRLARKVAPATSEEA